MRSQAALEDIDIKQTEVLYIGIDVGDRRWKLALTSGNGEIASRTIEAGRFEQVHDEVAGVRQEYGLSEDCQLISCYEAGRDGFWIHRRLEQARSKESTCKVFTVPRVWVT